MKKILIASAIAASFVASAAQAATANLTVNATVQSKCTISTSPTAVNLTVDPTSASATTGSSSFGYKCTKGVTPGTFTAGQGNNFSGGNRLRDGATTNYLPYTVSMPTASAGLGFGAASEITGSISISVAAADAAVATASSGYTDTVVITVDP